MAPNIAMIIGLIAAIACTVLVCIFILPKKKRNSLNTFFKWIHDVFNFRILFIETILKVVYIFMTLFCIAAGFFLLFSGYFSSWYSVSFAPQGLLLMILGPIILRIIYELIMLQILIFRNTNEINKKMGGSGSDIKEIGFDDIDSAKAARDAKRAQKQYEQQQYQQYQAQQQAQAQKSAPQPGVYSSNAASAEATEPNMVFCAYCGTRYDANKGGCPNGCNQ